MLTVIHAAPERRGIEQVVFSVEVQIDDDDVGDPIVERFPVHTEVRRAIHPHIGAHVDYVVVVRVHCDGVDADVRKIAADPRPAIPAVGAQEDVVRRPGGVGASVTGGDPVGIIAVDCDVLQRSRARERGRCLVHPRAGGAAIIAPIDAAAGGGVDAVGIRPSNGDAGHGAGEHLTGGHPVCRAAIGGLAPVWWTPIL